jgi:hypothetical protein
VALCRVAAASQPKPPGTRLGGKIIEGAAMPTVIGHHDVKDTKHWLSSSKREEFFGPLVVLC